jgi:hypothetical protein
MFQRNKKKYPVLGKDFALFQHPDYPEQDLVRILIGPYSGVEYGYSTVKLKWRNPERVSEGMCLAYRYNIVNWPPSDPFGKPLDNTKAPKDLEEMMGDIAFILLNDGSSLEEWNDWRNDNDG